MLQFLENQHSRALAEDEAVAIPIKGTAGLCRLVITGRQGRQQDEAGHAEGMDHAVSSSREDHIGTFGADHLVGLADCLGAGGAGRQAVGVEPLGAEDVGQVRGRGSGLLFRLGKRMEFVQPQPRELGSRDLAAMRRLVHKLDEPGKILLALAGSQVDAEPGAVQGGGDSSRPESSMAICAAARANLVFRE